MAQTLNTIAPDLYFRQMFTAKAARDGGVVRRSVRDVERIVGRDVFISEMNRRGFTTLENAGQFIVFCNREPVRRVTG